MGYRSDGIAVSRNMEPLREWTKRNAANRHLETLFSGSRKWGSPKPIHLKPGHLKMVFFTARRRLDGTFPVKTSALPI